MSFTLQLKSELDNEVISLRNAVMAAENTESTDGLADLTKRSKELREKSAKLDAVKKHFSAMRKTPEQLFQQLHKSIETAFRHYQVLNPYFKNMKDALEASINELQLKELQPFLQAGTEKYLQEQYRYALLTGLVWHFYQNLQNNAHPIYVTQQETLRELILKQLEACQLNETDTLVIFDEDDNIIESAATETYQTLYARAITEGVLTPINTAELFQQKEENEEKQRDQDFETQLALLDREIALLRARRALQAESHEAPGNTLLDDVTQTADELLTYMRKTASSNKMHFDVAKEIVATSKNMIVSIKTAIHPATEAVERTNHLAVAGEHAARLSVLANENITIDNSALWAKVGLVASAVLLLVGVLSLIALTHGGIAPFFAVAMEKSVTLASGKVIQDLTSAGAIALVTGLYSLVFGAVIGGASMVALAENHNKARQPVNALVVAGERAAENLSSQNELEIPLMSCRP